MKRSAILNHDQDTGADLWPASGKISVSDADILVDMVTRLHLSEDVALTADSVYAAFLEAKKASDAWVKYYMISVALLAMAAARAFSELSLFGTTINGPFIGPAAILYFSVCTLVYVNHELKMRLYRAFFKGRLDAMGGPDRAQILLRYPLAFYGSEYLPSEARPKGFVVSWKHILASLPTLGIVSLGWLLAVFGLMALLGYTLKGVYIQCELRPLIKGTVFVVFLGSMIVSAELLRSAKAKHEYQTERPNDR